PTGDEQGWGNLRGLTADGYPAAVDSVGGRDEKLRGHLAVVREEPLDQVGCIWVVLVPRSLSVGFQLLWGGEDEPARQLGRAGHRQGLPFLAPEGLLRLLGLGLLYGLASLI